MRRSYLSLMSATLRDPASLVDADRETLAWMVPRLLVVVVLGAAVFGGVVGSWRGGAQTVFAAAKMPFLLMVPMAVGLPAVRALFSTVDDVIPWHRIAAAGLVGAARSAILAAALAPVLWLLWSVVLDYHVATLVFALSLAAVGGQGLLVVRHVLPAGRRPALAPLAPLAVSVALLGVVTAQTGWVLRPFVARPRAEVTLLRPIEADIFSSLAVTTKSAAGAYGEWDPESRGLLREPDRWESRSDAETRAVLPPAESVRMPHPPTSEVP